MTENGRDRVIYDMYAHPFDYEWQRRSSPFWALDRIDIPVLSIREKPIEPGRPYELRIELLPMSVLVRAGERLRLEISNWESAITEAPMTHLYGENVGTDTYYHNAAQPSRLRLHERPRTNGASGQQ